MKELPSIAIALVVVKPGSSNTTTMIIADERIDI
jgi:hypothetical protein